MLVFYNGWFPYRQPKFRITAFYEKSGVPELIPQAYTEKLDLF
jgi:hypothetical protein